MTMGPRVVDRVSLSPRLDRRGARTAMTRAYLQVMVLEAAILVGLWIFGRIFS